MDIWNITSSENTNFVNTYQNLETVSDSYVWANLHEMKCNEWQNNISQLPLWRKYVLFNGNFCVEPDVRVNMDRKHRSVLAKLSVEILPLEVDTGRWKNVDTGNKLCQLCHIEVDDEYYFHFMFRCNQ